MNIVGKLDWRACHNCINYNEDCAELCELNVDLEDLENVGGHILCPKYAERLDE